MRVDPLGGKRLLIPARTFGRLSSGIRVHALVPRVARRRRAFQPALSTGGQSGHQSDPKRRRRKGAVTGWRSPTISGYCAGIGRPSRGLFGSVRAQCRTRTGAEARGRRPFGQNRTDDRIHVAGLRCAGPEKPDSTKFATKTQKMGVNMSNLQTRAPAWRWPALKSDGARSAIGIAVAAVTATATAT